MKKLKLLPLLVGAVLLPSLNAMLGENYQNANGFSGLNRDIILKLATLVDDSKAKNIFGMCYEYYQWTKLKSFKSVRFTLRDYKALLIDRLREHNQKPPQNLKEQMSEIKAYNWLSAGKHFMEENGARQSDEGDFLYEVFGDFKKDDRSCSVLERLFRIRAIPQIILQEFAGEFTRKNGLPEHKQRIYGFIRFLLKEREAPLPYSFISFLCREAAWGDKEADGLIKTAVRKENHFLSGGNKMPAIKISTARGRWKEVSATSLDLAMIEKVGGRWYVEKFLIEAKAQHSEDGGAAVFKQHFEDR